MIIVSTIYGSKAMSQAHGLHCIYMEIYMGFHITVHINYNCISHMTLPTPQLQLKYFEAHLQSVIACSILHVAL